MKHFGEWKTVKQKTVYLSRNYILHNDNFENKSYRWINFFPKSIHFSYGICFELIHLLLKGTQIIDRL